MGEDIFPRNKKPTGKSLHRERDIKGNFHYQFRDGYKYLFFSVSLQAFPESKKCIHLHTHRYVPQKLDKNVQMYIYTHFTRTC